MQRSAISFGDRLWSACVQSWGGATSFIGLALAVVVLFVVPDKATLPLNWTLLAAVVVCLLITTILRAAYDAHSSAAPRLPRVRMVMDAPKTYLTASALVLLDATDLLSHDSIVSLYLVENDVEIFLALGKVVNIQLDGRVQVVLVQTGERIQGLKQNRPDELLRLIVKPSVPSTYLREPI
jgi:hypothetical protein